MTSLKTRVGERITSHFGNLYTASLPAWIAAIRGKPKPNVPLAGERWLLMGYGSGDAAEALVATVVPGWEKAAASIDQRCLGDSVALSHDDYIAIHRDGESNVIKPLN